MIDLYREKNGQLSFVPVKEDTRDLYSYAGPAFHNRERIGFVKLSTWASSPKKAHANMIYQIKQKFGYSVNSHVTISINLIKKEECKYGRSV